MSSVNILGVFQRKPGTQLQRLTKADGYQHTHSIPLNKKHCSKLHRNEMGLYDLK